MSFLRTADRWAISTDGLQWILQRRRGHVWDNLSFVRTTKAILARCMGEKGVPSDIAEQLLDGLPDTFAERHKTAGKGAAAAFGASRPLTATEDTKPAACLTEMANG